MVGTKLFALISTFSKKEIKEFGLYVSSPFFTSGRNYPTEKLVRLTYCIIDVYPNLQSAKLDRRVLFTKLYGSRAYNDNTMRNLFSDLKALAGGYLMQCRAKQNSFGKEHDLLVELFNRKLEKEFLKQLKFCYKLLEGREQNSDFFYDRFRTTDYLSYFNGRKQNMNSSEIQDTYNDFNRFYILRALQQFILMINLGNLVKFQFKMPMYREVMKHIENNPDDYEKIPRIVIYYSLIRMLSEKEEKYFFILKDQLRRLESKLDIIDRNNIYVCLGNFCLEEIAKGNERYHLEKFENDKNYLASGLIHAKHFFHLNLFMSMGMNALDLEEYKWTESFIAEQITYVAPELQAFAKNYLTAELNYRKKYFDAALKYLAVINVEIPYYKQLIRNLKLKIFFDTGYINEALGLAETSVKFLYSFDEKDFNGRNDFMLFAKYYLALLKLKTKKPSKKGVNVEAELLVNEINSERFFRNKKWLLEKLKGQSIN